MSSARLSEEVELLRPDVAISQSGSGAAIEQFVPVRVVDAQVEPLRGGERFLSAERFAAATHRFRIRFEDGDDVEPTWRVSWRGRQYGIVEVLPAGRRLSEWIDVVATASPAENPVN